VRITKLDEVKPASGEEGVMRLLVSRPYGFLVHLELPPGKEVPPHSHGHGWMLYCLEGEIELLSADGNTCMSAGSAVAVEATEEVGLRNPNEAPVRALVFSPPTYASPGASANPVRVHKHKHSHGHTH